MRRRFRLASAWAPCVIVIFGLVQMVEMAYADPYRVTVKGNGTELGETPFLFPLGARWASTKYRLQPKGDGEWLPARIFQQGDRSYLAFVLKHVPAKGELIYSLETDGSDDQPGSGVEFRSLGTNLAVNLNGKLWTVYRTDEPTKPYYYPVFGPTGSEFTRDYPMRNDVEGEDRDHPHQRSLWFTHGDVNGIDFWASDPINKPGPKFGSIRETSREILARGSPIGVLRTTNAWLGPDGKPMCEDERVLRFYETVNARIMDFDVTLKATVGPVTFGDTKEGMFGVRVASSMDVVKGKSRAAGKITNAEALTDDAAWGKASPWVDYVGPVARKTVGIAILNHPESFRYPTTWHVRTYGLFAANPFGWHDFGGKASGAHTITRGEQLRFRYRVILHEGDTASAHIADAFSTYASPPIVRLERE